MWYWSANRDETPMFEDSARFDIQREKRHRDGWFRRRRQPFLPGCQLARREISVMLDEIFKAFPPRDHRRLTGWSPLHQRHQAHAVRVHVG